MKAKYMVSLKKDTEFDSKLSYALYGLGKEKEVFIQ